ncbi:MAG TPA: FixH family protein [Geobacteraceae bacterium]
MKEMRPAGISWKITLVVLICLFAVTTALSLFIAGRRVSRVVDSDYYRHGLHYGETHSSPGAAGADWSMAASLAGDQLQVKVRDGNGAPVTGGQVTCDLELGCAGEKRLSLSLVEAGPGVYRTSCPEALRGEGRGTMRCTRGDTAISGKLVVLQ